MPFNEQHLDIRRITSTVALLSGIVEGSDDAIIALNTDGTIISWNPGAERLFGYGESETIGAHITMLIPEDHRGEEQHILGEILAGRRIQHFETQRLRKDGTLVDVSLTVSPLPDTTGTIVGASKIVRDITHEREARRLQARLAAIVENADDAIIAKDTAGVITSWNPAAVRLFGYVTDEAIGLPISILMPPDLIGRDRDILSEILAGRKVDHYETRRMTKDGRVIDVSLTVSPLRDPDGSIVGASKIVRDVTTAKAERERHAAILAEANAQLAAADRLKDQFLAMASHEMRTPLTAIAGFTSTMQNLWDDLADDRKREFVEIIDTQTGRLQRLVDDLLTLARIESGALEARPRSISLATELEQTIRELGVPNIRIDCPHDLTAFADPDQVQQILVNLVGNAVKYGREPIRVSAQAVPGAIEIRVRDQGEGVPAEFVPQLFERFARASSRRSEVPGTGLGLSITRGLAHAQGGDAWYEPNEPRGSCFVFCLPDRTPASSDLAGRTG